MHNPKLIKTFTAASNIAARRLVTIDSDGNIKQAKHDDQVVGSVELPVVSGSRVDVVTDGIVEIEAASTISPGSWVGTNDDGCAVDVPNDNPAVGIAMDSATAGDYVSVRLIISRSVPMQRHLEEYFEASAAVAAGTIVKFDTNGKIVQASANTDVMLGVAMQDADTDHGAGVALSGIVGVTAGEAITAGAAISADSNGAAVAATSTKRQLGFAVSNAASGETVLVAIHPGVAA